MRSYSRGRPRHEIWSQIFPALSGAFRAAPLSCNDHVHGSGHNDNIPYLQLDSIPFRPGWGVRSIGRDRFLERLLESFDDTPESQARDQGGSHFEN